MPLGDAVFKMAQSGNEKAFCVTTFAKTISVITVQRQFLAKYAMELPHRHSIARWVKQFLETGCLCKGKSTGRMLSEWLMPQLKEKVPGFIFQQDGAPPHWHNSVREYLNEHLPDVGLAVLEWMIFHSCCGPRGPPTSHHATFICGGMWKTLSSNLHYRWPWTS